MKQIINNLNRNIKFSGKDKEILEPAIEIHAHSKESAFKRE